MSHLPTVGGGVCPMCSKTIITNLKRHMEDIHCPGEFPCPHCSKVFSSKNKLASHVSQTCRERKKKNSFISNQSYWVLLGFHNTFHHHFHFPGNVCPICNKRVAKLKYHMEDIHFPVQTPCPLCGKVFNSTNKMRTHKSSYHTVEEKAAFNSS